jgi:hypothetical protein
VQDMSKSLWPRDGIHFARLGDDLIMLDLRADSYSCLVGVGPTVRLEDAGRIVIDDEDFAAELESHGVVQANRPLCAARTPVLASREAEPSLASTDKAPVSLALAHLLVSTVVFRRKTLAQLVAAVKAGPRPGARTSDLTTVLSDYRTALPWTPFEGECLQRGFLLKRLLLSHGIAADWIFGVRTWPFAAHCWVQVGDLVVGDSLERVRTYTPIMVA